MTTTPTAFRSGRAFLVYKDGTRQFLARLNSLEDVRAFLEANPPRRHSRSRFKAVGIDWWGLGTMHRESVKLKSWHEGARWPQLGALLSVAS